MSFETFIARRYFGSGRFFVSVSTWITIIGVTLGVATVCFVTSMHNGFESEIRSRLLGTSSHITIFPFRGGYITDYRELVSELERLDHVTAVSPFIFYKAAISSSSAGDGIIVRGIDLEKERNTASIEQDIKAGVYSFNAGTQGGDTVRGMLIGDGLAERLGVYLGDPLVLYSLQGEDLRSGARPRVAKFLVTGIFETGLYEFDGSMAYISLPDAQNLFKTGDAVTAVHMKLDDIYLAEKMTPQIDSLLGFRYDVVPWTILHKNLFSWIAIEKLALSIGFSLIVLVAAFSIISTLVMLTMEKRSEIGILKTFGAVPASIRKIFVYKGLTIATVGVLSGWAISLAAGFVQNRWKIVSLPPDIYFISYVPIESHILDYLVAGGVTFVICFLAALVPSQQAARLSVIDVLRQ
ncbi:MAG: ABC transporter permease [candidate division Zixibacteria bacterium]|nr:ABC transporter permease [candidate division Zixibacteria bacterium]